MKTMTCEQLGGACDQAFSAETFDEMAAQSKAHGMEMFQKMEPSHMEAIKNMMALMANPAEFERWLNSKREEFAALPDD